MNDATPPGWTIEVGLVAAPGLQVLGYPDGTWRFRHRCDRSARDAGTIVCAPLLAQHVVQFRVGTDGTTQLWVTPSILCPDCGTHGWVTHGAWSPAP